MTDSQRPHFGGAFRIQPGAQGAGPVKFSMPAWGSAIKPAAPVVLPADAQGCNTLGNERLLAHRPQEALQAYDRAIELQPDYVDPHFNRSNALLRLNRLPEALAALDRTVELAPALVLAHYNRGTVLQSLGRAAEAMASYRQVLALEPGHVQARFNLGCIQLEREQLQDALDSLDRTIASAPQVPEAHNNRGVVLLKTGRLAEAVASFDKALALRSQYLEALNNRADARLRLGQHEGALDDLRVVLAQQPERVESRHTLARALRSAKRYEEAAQQFEWVAERSPDIPFVRGERLQARLACCDWRGLQADTEQLIMAVNAGQPVAEPFLALGVADDPAVHLSAARILVDRLFPPADGAMPPGAQSAHPKIRVGYFSADFHGHATSHLMAQLFEEHDREQFEWYAFSYGPDIQDAMRDRLVAGFDHFIDVSSLPDIEVVTLSRSLGIDIAVDLKGFTLDNRFGIFARRCAPVQVSYLGYPGSTGASYMDYVIADKVVLPAGSRQYFTEKVVYLPHCYQVNDSLRRISDRQFSRTELGLPEQGFVFCCFNNNYKILPPVFDVWMRLLQAVPGSVLWLLEDNPAVSTHLRREAQLRGVAAERLVFAPRMPTADHLARHRMADLFLDTLPVNAHTTASDALWAGLPVLTCMGRSFAARVAASLLHTVGLPELVTETAQDYEALAIALARDPARLQALRDKLHAQKASSPLFNARQAARDIEAAYLAMHRRHTQGLGPDVIEV